MNGPNLWQEYNAINQILLYIKLFLIEKWNNALFSIEINHVLKFSLFFGMEILTVLSSQWFSV